MKSKLLILLFPLTLLVGCNNTDENLSDENLTEEIEHFILRPETEIVLLPHNNGYSVSFSEGDKIVFHYILQRPQNPNISDDEVSENIVFQIDSSLNEFDYSNQDLIPLITHYFESCFCSPEAVEIISGNVSGQKINETTWNSTFDLNISFNGSTITKNISGSFSPL